MRIIFALIFINLFMFNAFAGSGSGNVSATFQLGGSIAQSSGSIPGAQITTPHNKTDKDLITLVAGNNAITGMHYYGFYSTQAPGSVTQFQVPAGKKLYVVQISETGGAAIGNTPIILGYGTAALIAEDTPTAPTGNVFYGSGITGQGTIINGVSGGGVYQTFSFPMQFPALSFPYIQPSTGGTFFNFIIIGYVE